MDDPEKVEIVQTDSKRLILKEKLNQLKGKLYSRNNTKTSEIPLAPNMSSDQCYELKVDIENKSDTIYMDMIHYLPNNKQ